MKNDLLHSACRGTQYVAFLYDLNRENVVPERPQTLRYYEIINSISAEHAQSKRGAHFQSLNCFMINQNRRAEVCAAALVTERRII